MSIKQLKMVPLMEGLVELTQTNDGVIEKQEILTTCELKELFIEFVKQWKNEDERKGITKAIENINDFHYLTVTHIPLDNTNGE